MAKNQIHVGDIVTNCRFPKQRFRVREIQPALLPEMENLLLVVDWRGEEYEFEECYCALVGTYRGNYFGESIDSEE
jgi:hypothetical protein